MSSSREKAKTVWLLSFGDMVTLLITFFIMMLVLNKGEINHLQKWIEDSLDVASYSLQQKMADKQLIEVRRIASGIEINISNDEAFVKGGYTPSDSLKEELEILGNSLKEVDLMVLDDGGVPEGLKRDALENGLVLHRGISVAGHTDSDWINPESSLRNNWFLSSMRAQNVMQLLFQFTNLDRSLFSVAGFGEYRPIAKNGSAEDKALNRRVQIVLSANFEEQG